MTPPGRFVVLIPSSTVLPLPPLPEQKKIAAILSSVDEAIGATEAVIAQTRRVKEGLLQDLLTRGIRRGGRPHTRFKETVIGEIPESWEVLRVSQGLCVQRSPWQGVGIDPSPWRVCGKV